MRRIGVRTIFSTRPPHHVPPQRGHPADPLSRELRRDKQRAHVQQLLFMVVASGGQTVWSASRSILHLWDSFSGTHLGTIQKDDVAPQHVINPLDPHNEVVTGGGTTVGM